MSFENFMSGQSFGNYCGRPCRLVRRDGPKWTVLLLDTFKQLTCRSGLERIQAGGEEKDFTVRLRIVENRIRYDGSPGGMQYGISKGERQAELTETLRASSQAEAVCKAMLGVWKSRDGVKRVEVLDVRAVGRDEAA